MKRPQHDNSDKNEKQYPPKNHPRKRDRTVIIEPEFFLQDNRTESRNSQVDNGETHAEFNSNDFIAEVNLVSNQLPR